MNNFNYEVKFIIALVLSIIIETPIYYCFIKFIIKIEYKFYDVIIFSILATSLTLPYVWFLFPAFIKNTNQYIIISELIVVIIEGLLFSWYFKKRVKIGLLISFVANFFSAISSWIVF